MITTSSNAIGFDKSTFYPFETFGEAHAAVSAPNKKDKNMHDRMDCKPELKIFLQDREWPCRWKHLKYTLQNRVKVLDGDTF
jgi:hypothetical protein